MNQANWWDDHSLNESSPSEGYDFDEIVPHLYLSGQSAAANFDLLKALDISAILTVGNRMDPLFPKEF